jgi:ATP-dependent Clp protease ATP-binding subunit ClpA
MSAQQPSLSTRARWIIRTQLAAVSPARKHTPGIHTRATGFLPFTSPARDAVAVAFREARHDGQRHWSPGHLPLGLATQDQGTAARVLERLGISQEQLRQQAGQITARDQQQAEPAPQPPRRPDRGSAGRGGGALRLLHRHRSSPARPVRADEQTAAQALARLGAGESQVRSAVTPLQAESGPERSA